MIKYTFEKRILNSREITNKYLMEGRVRKRKIKWGTVFRSVFMTISFVLCMAQIVSYIQMYLEYGTTVDIYIEKAKFIESPGFTFCKVKYGFDRAKFCGMLEKDSCDNRSSLDLMVEAKKMLVNLDVETLKSLESTIKSTSLIMIYDDYLFGQHLIESGEFYWSNRSCYGFNTCWKKPDYHKLVYDSSFKFYMELYFNGLESNIHLREKEMVELFIHTPEDIPFRTVEKVLLRPGIFYQVKIILKELRLLAPPYQTKCRNYTGDWYKNGGRGPLSMENCFLECFWNNSLRQCGCIPIQLPIFQHANKCAGNVEQYNCFNLQGAEYNKCKKVCRMDCVIKTFDYEVSGDFIYKSNDVEVLFYVGGFLSLWLNLSIPSIFQYAYMTLRFIREETRAFKQSRNKFKIENTRQ